MLKKLLKYDLQSVFGRWWIAAASSFVLSVLGGGCIILLKSERKLPQFINGLAGIALTLVVIGLLVLSAFMFFLILIRFYRNFFTDEGYLTFTLPASPSQHLNSKLITSIVFIFGTFLVCVADLFIIVSVAFAEQIFSAEFFENLLRMFKRIFETIAFYDIIYFVEIVALLLLSILFTNLLIFTCITFASIKAKKSRIAAAIGLFYAANCILTFFFQIFLLFGMQNLIKWFFLLPSSYSDFIGVFVLLGLISFLAIFCALLYALEYWLLDRKLNLT